MYTHELAEALKKMATILKNGPNMQLGEISDLVGSLSKPSGNSIKSKQSDDLPMALSALLSLARIDKREWIQLIEDMKLDVEIRPRDASRDIMGKVLRVLEINPEARMRLQRRVSSNNIQASPELARALSSLLSK